MRRNRFGVVLLALVALGCPKEPPCDPEVDFCDEPQVPLPDVCNSREEALSDSQCQLTLGAARSGHLSFSGDQDWYLAQLPQGLTARSLLHVSAGYSAPNTAVNLAVNVLQEDGATSLASEVDRHGQAAPRPVDIVKPFSSSGAKVLVLLADEGAGVRPSFDAKNPYSLTVEVLENPDSNEPNDEVPTAVPLAAAGAVLAGQATGYLATDDDVDRFTFTVPSGRKVLYLRLAAERLSPPPPFRLSYLLLAPPSAGYPDGRPVAEDHVENEFLPVDLATARLTEPGPYTLVVRGYRGPTTTGVLGGDVRQKYTLDVKVFDDLDSNEPNDSQQAPKVTTFGSPGGSASFTGRLGYVPDTDWYAFDLAPTGAPTQLSFKLTPSSAGARFAPLAPSADRQLRAFTLVTQGASAAERLAACKADAVQCPKGNEAAGRQALVEGLCATADPPPCLRAERNEHPNFGLLRNFEGVLPVPPHPSATLRYFVVVQDEGNDYADDLDYQLQVRWSSDPDEATRAGLPAETEVRALTESASFPVPSGLELSGTLTYGYGRVLQHRVNDGQGVRGPTDYDATATDLDAYELTLPAVTAPDDRTWTLQWEIEHLPDAGTPADLALDVRFCEGDGGTCATNPLTLAYSAGALGPWYSNDLSARVPLWRRDESGGATTVTAEAAGCFCFEPRFVRGGKFFLTVGSVDRKSYAPVSYKVRTGIAPYPQSYTRDGGTSLCPAPVGPTPGCRFTQ